MLELNKKEQASFLYQEVSKLLIKLDELEDIISDMDYRDNESPNHLTLAKQHLEYVKTSMLDKIVKDSVGVIPKEKDLTLTLEGASSLIKVVERKAKSIGISVVIAIYNKSGNPIAVHCMEDSYLASYDIAINKAYTSIALKISTSKLKELSQPGGSLYGIQHTNQGKIVIFGGGEPLLIKDKIIGSIGVSGGTEEEDTYLAQFGKEMVKEVT